MDKLLPEDILNIIPCKYYVINIKTREIVQTNDKNQGSGNEKCFKRIFNRESPCDIENNQCICERLLQSGNTGEFLGEKKDESGSRYFESKVSSFSNDLVLETVTDVTDKELLRKELKINSKRISRAEKLADFGYWEFNIENEIVQASDGTKRIYGITEDNLTIPDIQKYPLDKYRKKLDDSLRNLITNDIPYNVKFKIRRKENGEVRHVRSVAEYRKDKKMVFGILHDITENDKAQKALIESENNLKLLFQNMNSGFAFHKIVTDKNGRPVDYIFIDVNSKFEELTGLKREEVIGKSVLSIYPTTPNFSIERYGEVALTGEAIKFAEYSPETGKILEIAAYSPKQGYFAVTFKDVTDKIKSEKALDDSLKNLKLAQQIAKIGNWQYDPITGITEWSEGVYKILERDISLNAFSPEEYKMVFGKANYNKFIVSFKKAVIQGTPFQFQFKARIANNKTKWVEVICQPEMVRGLKGYELRGTIQDINESKQIEVELNTSNQLLQTIIDNIPDAIYMKNRELCRLVANKKDAELCKLEKVDDVVGKTDYDLYPFEIAQKYAEDDRKVIESGQPIINREEVLPFGDNAKWVLTSKIPLKDSENKIMGLVGIGRDITFIKEHESRLRMLQKVIEQSPLSVVITDTEGKIEYVNPWFEKTTGYKKSEAIGNNPRILNAGLQDSNYYKTMWDTVLSGKNWHGEFHNKRKDGTPYWESAIIAPIFDEKNQIKQLVAIKEDITNIKQMVKDLEIAKEKAEESDRLKTVFLANMSHEIRTPLNGILGFSNIICSGMCDAGQLEKYGRIIENSGQRLMTVIDDIIDISMIQSNQLKIEREDFNLNELLEEVFVVYKNQKASQLSRIDFKMETCLKTENNHIISDKNRVYQILKNLLDNAFKFTETGHIKFGCLSSTTSEIVLYVEDTGIGIEEGKTGLIFEIFRQVEEGNSRRYDGSGLGLAITSGIVERLGGEIVVKSEIKKGTAFYVTLPRNNEKKPTINGKRSQVTGRDVAEIKSKKIVSFEDDKTSAQYLKIVVNQLGYELVNFETAPEGIEYLKNNGADMVLMDAQLPGMNGYQATQIIKSELPGIPVIMQSAFAMKSDKDKAIQAGCDDYLSKPVSMRQLKDKIEKFVECNVEGDIN